MTSLIIVESIHVVLSTIIVVLYLCLFVMGFGPTSSILYSEIFPTWVRGICIAIRLLTFWICDILVSYSHSMLLRSIGLAGVFVMYALSVASHGLLCTLKSLKPKAFHLKSLVSSSLFELYKPKQLQNQLRETKRREIKFVMFPCPCGFVKLHPS